MKILSIALIMAVALLFVAAQASADSEFGSLITSMDVQVEANTAEFQVRLGAYFDSSASQVETIIRSVDRPGDAFLLMRLGVPPKGIIGFGQVLSRPYSLPHWDEEKARDGKTALRVDLLFNQLSDSPLVEEKALKTGKETSQFDWFPQASGVLIPQNIASHILRMIEKQTESKYQPLTSEKLMKISEGKEKLITITSYYRSPFARQLYIDHYGTTCVICGSNFEVVYGQIDKGFIHVHHLKQIADVGEEYEIYHANHFRRVMSL